jgi:hypothetical protein
MPSLNIDSELFQLTQAAAAVNGKTVEQFVEETLRDVIGTASPKQSMRNGLPVMVMNGTMPEIDVRSVRRSIEEDGF